MSGLVLKLAASERLLINGAVIRNGSRNSTISILTPNANILRLKDALHPDEAQSPVSRICYMAQLILSGDHDAHEGTRLILAGINELLDVFSDHEVRSILIASAAKFNAGKTYAGLKLLRKIIPIEKEMLEGSIR